MKVLAAETLDLKDGMRQMLADQAFWSGSLSTTCHAKSERSLCLGSVGRVMEEFKKTNEQRQR